MPLFTAGSAPGDQLPAIRVLAEELVINPNTVARAYQDLVREGIAETRAGVGLFILRGRPDRPGA